MSFMGDNFKTKATLIKKSFRDCAVVLFSKLLIKIYIEKPNYKFWPTIDGHKHSKLQTCKNLRSNLIFT
jgi:hypothetical protein